MTIELEKTSRQDLDLLSYRPSLLTPPEKATDSLYLGEDSSTSSTTSTESAYSQCLSDYLTFMSGKVIRFIEEQQQTVSEHQQTLRQILQKETNYSSSFESFDQVVSSFELPKGYLTTVKDYYETNRDDVAGSFALDLFYQFSKIERELERLKRVLLWTHYGITDGILPDAILEEELEIAEQIKKIEKGEQEGIVVYQALAMDTLINRAAYKLATVLTNFVLDLYVDWSLDLETPPTYGELTLTGIQTLFDDFLKASIKEEAKMDRYFKRDLMTDLFKRCREMRDQTLEAYQNEEAFCEAVQSDLMIKRTIYAHKRLGFDQTLELTKYVQSLKIYLDDVKMTLREKQRFRQIYSEKV